MSDSKQKINTQGKINADDAKKLHDYVNDRVLPLYEKNNIPKEISDIIKHNAKIIMKSVDKHILENFSGKKKIKNIYRENVNSLEEKIKSINMNQYEYFVVVSLIIELERKKKEKKIFIITNVELIGSYIPRSICAISMEDSVLAEQTRVSSNLVNKYNKILFSKISASEDVKPGFKQTPLVSLDRRAWFNGVVPEVRKKLMDNIGEQFNIKSLEGLKQSISNKYLFYSDKEGDKKSDIASEIAGLLSDYLGYKTISYDMDEKSDAAEESAEEYVDTTYTDEYFKSDNIVRKCIDIATESINDKRAFGATIILYNCKNIDMMVELLMSVKNSNILTILLFNENLDDCISRANLPFFSIYKI